MGYQDIPYRPSQSPIPVAEGGTGLATSAFPVWTKYSVVHTTFQTAATTNNVELFSLPAKAVIHAVFIKQSTAFAGCATYTLSVGIAGTLDKYLTAYDVKAAVAATTFGSGTVIGAESFGGAVSIKVAATSTVNNLSASSAGAADIWILTSLLP